jgi:hypothetical protein
MKLNSLLILYILLIIYIAVGLLISVWRQLHKKRLVPDRKRLILLLEKAEKIVSGYSGGYSGEFLSAEEFHNELRAAIKDYKNGDDTKLDYFYIWFAPACAWDDFVGQEGEKPGNEIFEMVGILKRK